MPAYDPNANPYIINPLELPANQTAAAMVPAVNKGTNAQWASSPAWTWPDVSTASRTTTAQVALTTEQARLQARQDRLNTDIARITAVP
jgi:hypothetical protein